MKRKCCLYICVLLCCVSLLAGCSTYSVGTNIGPAHKWMEETGDIYYNGYLIHKTWLGFVEVYKIGNTIENGGDILKSPSVSFDKLPSHLTMLSLRKGMPLPQAVAALGMPDGMKGSGNVRLYYNLLGGYQYFISFASDSSANNHSNEQIIFEIHIADPSGNYLSSEETAAFQWTVRLIYLAIAATLGVVLVLLIKIPNNIRKRKGIASAE